MPIDISPHLDTSVSDFTLPEIEGIIEGHSVRVLGLLDMTPDDVRVRKTLTHMHPNLLIRLRQLKANPFHNLDHFLDVHRRLWMLLENLLKKSRPTTSKMLLLGEAALRHDDDHAGNTYRQDVIEGAEMSNEEWATYLLEQDIIDHDASLTSPEIIFTRDAIHMTSFGQNTLPKDDSRYRPYKAKTLEQQLLVFADIGGPIIDGWEYWIRESVRVIEEIGPMPSTLGEWIATKIEFLEYVELTYREIQPLFKREFQATIERNLYECKEWIEDLLEGKYPEEQERIEKLIGVSL